MPKDTPQDVVGDSPPARKSRRGTKPIKVLPELSKLSGIQISQQDARKWMALIEARGSKDPLFRMADRMQAGLVITGILTIQGIYAGVAAIVEERGGLFTVDDLNKLTNSLNRAMASVNQSLNHLGVTGKERKEPVDVDSLAQALDAYDLDNEIPPGLEEAHISAKTEFERMGTSSKDDKGKGSLGSGDNEEVLSILKQPLKSYVEAEDEVETVVDVEKDGIEVL
jgi:hypothetical protein